MLGFVGMGSNLGDRWSHLRDALAGMSSRRLTIVGVSSVWETEAVGWDGAPPFLNAVAAVRTDLEPEEVLAILHRLESRAGRRRSARNAPRTLDLDLLLLGDRIVDSPGLVLPHPRMWQRRFVLAPLAELAPDRIRPETGRTVEEELAALPERPVARRVGDLALPERPPVYSPTRSAGEP